MTWARKDSNISRFPGNGFPLEEHALKASLTQKQQAVYTFVQQYLETHRRAPFIREVQAGCAIASYKSVIDRLNALERKGYIRRAPNKHRGIRLVHRDKPAQPVPATTPADVPSLEAV